MPPESVMVTEHGAVAQRFLPRNLDPDHEYDVIVVGSGMGGGVLASQLARRGQDVLVCEVGSYLFPTHVGNLARQLRIGQFDKHVWSLWDDFRVRNYETASADVGSYQGFNLGGRSLFWGGLIPRQAGWELASWPARVRADLLDGGYADAERVLNRVAPDVADFQREAREELDARIPGFVAQDAPLAVQYNGATPLALPAGLFSTADLLLEDRMLAVAADPVDAVPQVNLNTAVQRVLLDGDRAVGVQAFDVLTGAPRTYRGRTVVLCAGTIESAKIALLSGVGGPLAGTGLTDHLIQFRHFALPPGVLDVGPTDSAKVLLRHPDAQVGSHGFAIVVELGAYLNQGRYVDPVNLERERAVRAGWTLCEIVFMYYGALQEQNAVTLQGGDPGTPVRLAFDRAMPPDADRAEAAAIAEQLFTQLGATAIPGENGLWLQDALLGGVAHEVGTLRMGEPGAGVVDADLRFHGLANLYACDNSVFPASPAANPSLTTVALAVRLAAHLAG